MFLPCSLITRIEDAVPGYVGNLNFKLQQKAIARPCCQLGIGPPTVSRFTHVEFSVSLTAFPHVQ